MNEKEFWTKYPLPSIAINDPYFHYDDNLSNAKAALDAIGFSSHDIDNNSWSGPTNGLTYQRAIGALMRYGHHAEQILLAGRVLELVKKSRVLVQNYNPLTGEYSKTSQNGYGPMVIATLENISFMQGVNISKDDIIWTSYGNDEFEYTQRYGDATYKLAGNNGCVSAYLDGVMIFSAKGSIRIKTDMKGKILAVFGISSEPCEVSICVAGRDYTFRIAPNEELALTDSGFVTVRKVAFK